MNKIILWVALIANIAVEAQGYSFQKSVESYNDLPFNDISVNNGLTWNDPQYSIPIGFHFNFWGTVSDTIFIPPYYPGGIVSFSETVSGTHPVIVAYFADILDRASTPGNWSGSPGSLSPISYFRSGIVGNRILKIQWKNVGFQGDISANGSSTDYTNFQLWLYEGSNVIEVRFGPNSISGTNAFYGETGSAVGLLWDDLDQFEFLEECVFLGGNPAAPSVYSSLLDAESFSGPIPQNMVYRFTPQSNSVHERPVSDAQISIYPNPTQGEVFIAPLATKITEIEVYNLMGQHLKTIPFSSKIDFSGFSTGIYVLKIKTNRGLITRKVMKK